MLLSEFERFKDNKKHILVTGGTGFIGKRLIQVLAFLDHEITVLTRNIQHAEKTLNNSDIDLVNSLSDIDSNTHFDVIINLAGESLASGRWSNKRKENFVQSRLDITSKIGELVQRLNHKPEVLINGSAIGFYGAHNDEVLDENSDFSNSFSHDLCKRWETQALKIGSADTRVCLLRIGIVLGDDGGPLAELRIPYKFGVSMVIASGKQWMSWIHKDDLVSIILYAMNKNEVTGPINGTAPNPVTNKGFADALSVHYKTFMRINFPAKVLSLLVGELADEVLIAGQRVIPTKIQNMGFIFQYPELTDALEEIIG